MARSELLSWAQAVDVFDSRLEGWLKIPWSVECYSPHLVAKGVHDLYAYERDPLDSVAFIDGWMRWQRARKNFGYKYLDTEKVLAAADFAVTALCLGVLTTHGAKADRRLWRPAGAPVYERNSSGGGRLRIPAQQEGERRVSVDTRHGLVAAPIIMGLLRVIADHPDTGEVPGVWIKAGHVPALLAGWKVAAALGILATAHEGTGVVLQVSWMTELRRHLLSLGEAHREPPAADVEALRVLA